MPHRLEPVGEVDGVRYVNDSKATNVAAALRALAAYADEPVHLILGGSLKGEGFAPLAAAIGPNVRSIHLIGEAAGALARRSRPARAHDDGDPGPRRRARRRRGASPATSSCSARPARATTSSTNFERRGEHFRRLVAELESR